MIFVLSGPGGAGKGAICSGVVARDDRIVLSRSWTTRGRRDGEPADAYRFVDRAMFEAEIQRGGFLEHADVLGNWYGTPLPTQAAQEDRRDLLLEINVEGARQIRVRYDSAVIIFVVAPSHTELAARMRRRGDPAPAIDRRLRLALDEDEIGRALADHVVINDDLERAVDETLAVIAKARQAAGRA
jgi:guanylate kinase